MIEYYATENLNKLGDFLKRCLDETIMDEFIR